MANAALPSADAYQHFYGSDGNIERDPTFRDQITSRTIEYIVGYEPCWHVPNIAPTALLMEVASHDVFTPTAAALEVFETAAEPKKLVVVPGGHLDCYHGRSGELAKAQRVTSSSSVWGRARLASPRY